MTPMPFRWLPAEGVRHAFPNDFFVPGEQVTTLAGEQVMFPAARPGVLEWLWPTCLACWSVAKELVRRQGS